MIATTMATTTPTRTRTIATTKVKVMAIVARVPEPLPVVSEESTITEPKVVGAAVGAVVAPAANVAAKLPMKQTNNFIATVTLANGSAHF
jgi:hypothetical protein